ncbi:MAG: SDR family NAD(P)-dependent oxidoreductase [Chitinophagales bacterium]|nr:SDR family NAD(P)-dependent oxidoreductase [Chitinophagales bacterium]
MKSFFQNKTLVVSGVSRGIGKALILQGAKMGMKVAGFDVKEELLAALKQELDLLQASYYITAFDIRDANACQQFILDCKEKLGAIDMLINNAGITHIAPENETTPTDFKKLIDINLLGLMQLSHFALPFIIENKGTLAGISSVAGYSPLLYRTAYAASKHGVWGYLSSLRAEMKEKQVQVLTVCPSFVSTDLQENQQKYFNNTTQEALTPEFVATEIFKAIYNRKDNILIGKTAKQAYWFNKLFPKWYEKIMIKKMKA